MMLMEMMKEIEMTVMMDMAEMMKMMEMEMNETMKIMEKINMMAMKVTSVAGRCSSLLKLFQQTHHSLIRVVIILPGYHSQNYPSLIIVI